MTRHEADRVHEASGIAFTFAGHLVWGNPRLASKSLHGDVEAWRCSQCLALACGDEAEMNEHAEQHRTMDDALGLLLDSIEALRVQLDKVSHGAFKPIETQPQAERERRNPSATAYELGADVQRMTRVARWHDAAAVREVTE